MNRYGYACINTELSARRVTANRGMIKRTWLDRGAPYASELALANVIDLRHIVEWNVAHGINVFRVTSDVFPWCSEYDILELPDIEAIAANLDALGKYCVEHDHRLSMHPGQFVCLASPKPDVVDKAVTELENHALVMDLIGAPRSPAAKINIHVGGTYGDPVGTLARFVDNLSRLSEAVRTRLTVENDDKPGCYSVSMLHRGVHEPAGVPIVFDTLHYACGPTDVPVRDAIELAISTWPADVRPTCHHSSSRKLHEDPATRSVAAHSDFIYDPFPVTSRPVDVVLECKAKEQAVFRFVEDLASAGETAMAS